MKYVFTGQEVMDTFIEALINQNVLPDGDYDVHYRFPATKGIGMGEEIFIEFTPCNEVTPDNVDNTTK